MSFKRLVSNGESGPRKACMFAQAAETLCIRVRGGPPSWERSPNDWKLPLSFCTPAPVSFDLFTLIKDNSIWQPPRTVLLFGHSTRDMIAFSPSSVFKNGEEKLILRVSDRHRGPPRGVSFFCFFLLFFFRFCSPPSLRVPFLRCLLSPLVEPSTPDARRPYTKTPPIEVLDYTGCVQSLRASCCSCGVSDDRKFLTQVQSLQRVTVC